MRIGPNGVPIKKKGGARQRRERRERYLLYKHLSDFKGIDLMKFDRNHELNKCMQRVYARERACRIGGKAESAGNVHARDWISLGIHTQTVMLALWAGMRAADDSVQCPGLPPGIHHLHAGFMTFSHLYGVYEALFPAAHLSTFPLDRGDVRSLLKILERSDWLFRSYDGVCPDGVFATHDALLTVSLVEAGAIEEALFGNEGVAAPEVKQMFKQVDEKLQVAMMNLYRSKVNDL